MRDQLRQLARRVHRNLSQPISAGQGLAFLVVACLVASGLVIAARVEAHRRTPVAPHATSVSAP